MTALLAEMRKLRSPLTEIDQTQLWDKTHGGSSLRPSWLEWEGCRKIECGDELPKRPRIKSDYLKTLFSFPRQKGAPWG